jgi:hypothetical protein
MERPDRVISLLAAMASATFVACGAEPRAPAPACSGDEQCEGATWCTEHACVQNSAPIASFLAPSNAASNATVTLDGSQSADPDERDEVSAYRWTVAVSSAPCAAPIIESTTATATVRFACAGAFDVSLVVTDSKGAASAKTTRRVTVGASPAAQVSAGADQLAQHTCAGAPAKCHPEGTVKLAGSALGSTSGAVTYAWTVIPPSNRPLDATRRVTFLPGPNVADPTVALETDGTPISGDWGFELEIRDGTGSLGKDTMRLSVANRAPVVKVLAAASYPHTYDASAKLYRSSGTVSLQLSDPDGDPVTHKEEWRHTGDEGGQFGGQSTASAVSFAIAVTDPVSLADGAGLTRAIVVTGDDGNGGVTSSSAPILVGNNLPTLAAPTSATVGHTYSGTADRFSATASFGRWIDPDGDPLTTVPATDDPDCTSILQAGGGMLLSCSAAYTDIGSLARFAKVHTIEVHASDPWGTGTSKVSLNISNRPPTVAGSTMVATMACSSGTVTSVCCYGNYGSCVTYGNAYAGGTYAIPLSFSDPDGDPVQLSARETTQATPMVVTCTTAGCTAALAIPVVKACQNVPSYTVATQVSDGLALASGSTVISTSCH